MSVRTRRFRSPLPGFTSTTKLAPAGVVALIVPWNFPFVTTAWKVAPALAAGCTIVLEAF